MRWTKRTKSRVVEHRQTDVSPAKYSEPDISARALGDSARDLKNWPEAVLHYQRYLNQNQKDDSIWVQLGHAFKESENLVAAEDAYRTAQRLNSADADIPLQLGHLLKLTGRRRAAQEMYKASYRLNPSLNAYEEFSALAGRSEAARQLTNVAAHRSRRGVYFQINDLMNFMRAHKTPSGIQRVQIGIIDYITSGLGDSKDFDFICVYSRPDDRNTWKVQERDLRAFLECLENEHVDHDELRGLINSMEENSVLTEIKGGDAFVILGAFWSITGNTNTLAALSREGVYTYVYIYDLIPITHPEYCDRRLVADFTREFAEIAGLTDAIFAISDYTNREVKGFLEQHRFDAIPVVTVPLAHRLTGSREDLPSNMRLSHHINAKIGGKPFVLCVCTIEPRKNHRYIIEVWRQLQRKGVEVPRLVLVGRGGWNNENLFQQLENARYLDGSVVILHDLSDVELSKLYQDCLFTVFPSFVEGWGLPIGESLVKGKICVTSKESSMPEVGGSFVVYIDPYDVNSGVMQIENLLADPERRMSLEINISSNFVPRTWSSVSSELISAITTSILDGNRRAKQTAAFIPAGHLVEVGKWQDRFADEPIEDIKRLERLSIADTWYQCEEFGAWMKGNTGLLEFDTGLNEGTNVVVFLGLVSAPNADGKKLKIYVSEVMACEITLSSSKRTAIRVNGMTSESGRLLIRIFVEGTIRAFETDPRVFCVGITYFSYAACDDWPVRLDLNEKVMLRFMNAQ